MNIIKETIDNISYIPYKDKQLEVWAVKKKRKGIAAIFGFILFIIQAVITFKFIMSVINLDILPDVILYSGIAILTIFLLYVLLSQFSSSHILGKFISAILISAMIMLSTVSNNIIKTLDKINKTVFSSIETVYILTNNSSEIFDFYQLSGKTGYNILYDYPQAKKVAELLKDSENVLNYKEYNDWDILLSDLKEEKIESILLSNNSYDMLKENYENIDEYTKILCTLDIPLIKENKEAEMVADNEPFVIYISGNDGYGEISLEGRSDVNILMCINPKTRQVLLISTPRDYYIEISRLLSSGEVISGRDKLTHAGNCGIEYSMKALSDLYGVDINYFYKINFSGCINVIDALGGITINSDVAFRNGYEAAPVSYDFNIGENECDGEKTLAFVRERKAFLDGDLQRGRNQEAAIEGMINKLTSPSIITNYADVLNAVSEMFITNMPTKAITSLAKNQLKDNTPWNIQSYSVGAASTGMRRCEVYGFNASCVIPDYNSVNLAIQMINNIQNGIIFDVNELTNPQIEGIVP